MATRKKNLKPRKRGDHPAQCRVNDAELARVTGDIASLQKDSPIPISLGAYTKLSILDHFRLRRIEAQLKKLVDNDDGWSSDGTVIVKLKGILEGA